ncbi:MAG: sigma-54-dependent Fis family transcriptional regulator [Chromatiaceae bacterium]|nr:sigma-54-dependent Fis family transcriptional regulator [Chromatiaceae bacterium]
MRPHPSEQRPRVLVSWIGRTDLNAASGKAEVGLGPIAQALKVRAFDRVLLLCNYPPEECESYRLWAARHVQTAIELEPVELSSPMHFGEIHEAVTGAIARLSERLGPETRLTFHLSPGTSAMAAVWIILAKTRYGAELIESSREAGVKTAVIPFDLSAEFIPAVYRQADRELMRFGAGLADTAPAFSDIICRGPAMREVIARARRVAARSVPVLIEGESGTGKEMLARAIHRASPRREQPFIAVNCGALARELAASELFGHQRGAFTGATQNHAGYFEAASGGTLFLDEIGELEPDLQVKLLRVLQEGEVVRLGTTSARPIDVRLIAATNRTLAAEVAAGRFRPDLFFRIAVALIRVPPLRERQGDFRALAEYLLDRLNRDSAEDPGWEPKRLAPAALNRLARHAWPGNVRELANTLTRAALWSHGPVIGEAEVVEALLELPAPEAAGSADLLGRSLDRGVDLPALMRELAAHYLGRALEQCGGNKSRAARLLGLPSYQTLGNWLERYGVEPR